MHIKWVKSKTAIMQMTTNPTHRSPPYIPARSFVSPLFYLISTHPFTPQECSKKMNSIRPYLPVVFQLDSTPANQRNLPNTIYTITYAFLFSTTMTRDRRPWGPMRAQQRYEITTNISYSVLNNPNVSISVHDAFYLLLRITCIRVLLQSFGILPLPSSLF